MQKEFMVDKTVKKKKRVKDDIDRTYCSVSESN